VVKIATVARGSLPVKLATIAGVGLPPRSNQPLHDTQHDTANLTVSAPPANDHRSLAGDGVLRRRRRNGDETALQGIIEQARDRVRCGSSPGGCRA
jgi:hypothetical protein